ncbi:gamma-glutamyl AIG2-like cyclotransferase [Winogradskyella epiphytica]|uniref:Gamma-glutamyl AIG2-like cyclotransferase n=1 Tax=Winogradskyella epiphytica TaxID=262005 RepID=A0A2V4WZ12_9FLAO|nr:AAA family ATPase [Winogradskyella epiphytica]PYE82658.1 gamma-glutamyl AIG2-like cyclotransferase [Winogradskyella epiphytica]GGW72504.1 hypothetical protein GCM10008085_26010 [Winogradskyella epiphytica]
MAYHSTTTSIKNKVIPLEELHLSREVRVRINQLIEEFTYKDALNKLEIPVDNKILLYGHTGCGKTATASAIGFALNKKVITINLAGFVSSRLGETAKNLAEIFKKASSDKAIVFIDEFDFIGKLRDYDQVDSGEMKRLVNALIQQIDHLSDDTLLICATNHIEIIDTALLRRFQIRLTYELPSKEQLDTYYDDILSKFPESINTIDRHYGISYAEAKDITFQQIKGKVINLEKQRKHLVFTYGELTSKDYASLISKGTKDVLPGYKLIDLNINPSSQDNKTIQASAKKTRADTDQIEGVVFELSGAELVQTDKREQFNYKRVLETTTSGKEVWVYVDHNSF